MVDLSRGPFLRSAPLTGAYRWEGRGKAAEILEGQHLGGRYVPPAGYRLWTPDDLTVLPNHWWDASEASTLALTVNEVDSWTSRGALALALPARNAASKPTYSPNRFRGKPCLISDGSTDCILADPTGATNAQWNGANSKSANVFMAARYRSGTVWLKWENFPSRWGVEGAGTWDYPQFGDRLDTLTYPTRPAIMYLAPTGDTKRLYVNDIEDASNEAYATTSGSVTGYISMFASSDGGFAAAIDIAEVVHLNYTPSATEIDQITGYLAHKYSLQAELPADHPYRHEPPLFATGGVVHDGAAVRAATSAETLTGIVIQSATATRAATSAETLVATVIQSAAASRAATSAEALVGNVIQSAAASDASVSSEALVGNVIQSAAATRAATSTETAAAVLIAAGAATDAATSTGSATEGAGGVVTGDATDAATSGETLVASVIQSASATRAATSSESFVGIVIQQATAARAATSSESFAGIVIQQATAARAATSAETVAAVLIAAGAAVDASTSSEAVAGIVIQQATAARAATSSEALAASLVAAGATVDASTSAETAAGILIQQAVAVRAALTAETLAATLIAAGAATDAAVSTGLATEGGGGVVTGDATNASVSSESLTANVIQSASATRAATSSETASAVRIAQAQAADGAASGEITAAILIAAGAAVELAVSVGLVEATGIRLAAANDAAISAGILAASDPFSVQRPGTQSRPSFGGGETRPAALQDSGRPSVGAGLRPAASQGGGRPASLSRGRR